MKYCLSIFLALVIMLPAAFADQGQELIQFDTVEKQQRYHDLLDQLRCLVCQNQSLAGSGAGLAKDLREAVEQGIRNGDNDEQILEFMVNRYGDFVLYNPPLKKSTILLWFLPYIFLCIAGIAGIWFVVQRNENKADTKISETRRKRAAELLKMKNDSGQD